MKPILETTVEGPQHDEASFWHPPRVLPLVTRE
jgi:hypothetical protein